MIPILYKSSETNFEHNGLGALVETLECTATEERNGIFELELEYPVEGRLYNDIKKFAVIKAKTNRTDDELHLFRVYDYELSLDSKSVFVFAHSITNDLAGNLVLNASVDNLTAQQALNQIKQNLLDPTHFTFYSDISDKKTVEWVRRNPLNCIAGDEESMVELWGGEIKRTNAGIRLLKRRGRDKVTVIRHGKNLTGLTATYSTKGMVTQILPFIKRSEGEEETTLIGSVVQSPYVNNYPVKFTIEVDYSQDDTINTLAQLNSAASSYFSENEGIDVPSVNMEIDIDDLSDSAEYEKFKDLERVELTDTVTVYAREFGVNIVAKVTGLVFNVLTDKIQEITVGSVQTRLVESVEKTVNQKMTSTAEAVVNVVRDLNVANKIIFTGTGEKRIDFGSSGIRADGTKVFIDGGLWLSPTRRLAIGTNQLIIYNENDTQIGTINF